jgi:hypothetical protein
METQKADKHPGYSVRLLVLILQFRIACGKRAMFETVRYTRWVECYRVVAACLRRQGPRGLENTMRRILHEEGPWSISSWLITRSLIARTYLGEQRGQLQL